jgi:hypothetical protein
MGYLGSRLMKLAVSGKIWLFTTCDQGFGRRIWIAGGITMGGT